MRHPPRDLAQSLQRVTDAALAYLDLDRLMDALLERTVEILDADTSAVLLLDEDTNELAARAAQGLEEEVEQGFRLKVGSGFAGRVAAERRPIVIEQLKPGDAVNPLLYQKKIRSLIGVPLIVEGRLLGVLHVGSIRRRVFTQEDATLLQIVADRVALAIDHARLFQEEREARESAEQALERLRRLQGVTESALAQLDLDDLLSVLLDRVVAMLKVDTAAILIAGEDAAELLPRATRGLEQTLDDETPVPIGDGLAGRVATERRPIARVDTSDVSLLPFEREAVSLLGVPMIVEHRLVGVMHVGSRTEREFDPAEVDLLQAVADRAALAIEHDRLFEQHRVAERLQRSLLPDDLPQPPGLALAARYLPAAAKRLVGGDWYDVIEMPDGRVGIAIGDVVGHGLDAAMLMGALRHALQAYALQGLAPSVIAPLLARYAAAARRPQMATYLYGVIDASRSAFRFVNASHPPPVVVRPDGTAEVITAPLLPPLGASAASMVEETVVPLVPGTAILLYTDGLIEQRGLRLSVRQQQLHDVASRSPAEPDLLCDSVIKGMLDGARPADDVAVLSVQRAATADETLDLTIAARAEELAAIRRLLRGWLAGSGADRPVIDAVLLASGEACTNAIEHAYGPGEQTFELHGHRDGDDVVLVVRDRGRWRPPRGTNRGRGLSLIERFMDEVDVKPGDTGTEVRMRKRIAG